MSELFDKREIKINGVEIKEIIIADVCLVTINGKRTTMTYDDAIRFVVEQEQLKAAAPENR